MAAPMPTAAGSRVRLYFRCEKLQDKDTFSKSDPYLVLHQKTDRLREVGRTETIDNNLNPVFKRSIEVDFLFEVKQEFVVTVYDDDGGKKDAENDNLGRATFQLAHVVGSRNATLKINLDEGQGSAVFVSAEELGGASSRDTIQLSFAGTKLKKMDFFGKSDPYFKLYRLLPNGTKTLLHHSKTIDCTLEPKWPELPKIKVDALSGRDLTSQCLLFECYDEDVISDDSMGEFKCSLQELMDSARNHTSFTLREKGKPTNTFGEILCTSAALNHAPTFLEFLRGGMQVNLAVSIDFTGSNGLPREASSLHYMSPTHPNQYVRAIMAVGDILMPYDTDQQVPVFGFGATMPDGAVSHCFHVNFQQNPYVQGVQGILDSYGRALSTVRLAGPTNFAPTIENALRLARSSPQTYTILLILTDGEITDMDRTINAICQCDDAPLSIVIVGVGNCGFEMMDQLDADNEPLKASNGRPCRRDLVQFVPFRQFEHDPAKLAAEVLREVPDQVVDWAMLTHAVPPAQQQRQMSGGGGAPQFMPPPPPAQLHGAQ